MGLFSGWFGKRESVENPLKCDMHNHILFGIDDGSKTIDDSLAMAEMYLKLGYKKVIATPHVMSDYYPNNAESIAKPHAALNAALKERGMELETGFAAEYYMDEFFLGLVRDDSELLSFGNRHVLVETSFMNKPVFFEQIFFEMRTKSYQPVLAHPERYVYFHNNYEDLEKLFHSGVKLQINLLSLIGHYSPAVRKLAQWLIKEGYYHFLGTDAHNTKHLELLDEVYRTKSFAEIDFGRVENTHVI